MRHWPRKVSAWDGIATAPGATRSGNDPINPLRILRLRNRGLTYAAIGIQIAYEDGRQMPYVGAAVYRALREFQCGLRDEDGGREFRPATNKRCERCGISLGTGIGAVMRGWRVNAL
jgi:hypothetical protein